jgi:hypothetical protein
MALTINNDNFKKTIILFWTAWWLIALWTDAVGVLAHVGWLSASWAPDLNYPFLADSLKIYHVPDWLTASLFVGILAWSLVSTLVFCWASMAVVANKKIWMYRAKIAFIISLTYWLAFFLSDQLVMKFDLEENHMVQGGFQLLSYLALYLLPAE